MQRVSASRSIQAAVKPKLNPPTDPDSLPAGASASGGLISSSNNLFSRIVELNRGGYLERSLSGCVLLPAVGWLFAARRTAQKAGVWEPPPSLTPASLSACQMVPVPVSRVCARHYCDCPRFGFTGLLPMLDTAAVALNRSRRDALVAQMSGGGAGRVVRGFGIYLELWRRGRRNQHGCSVSGVTC